MTGHAETFAYLGLGASLGDRYRNIAIAIERLASAPGILVRQVSPMYESAHIGVQAADAERFPRHLNCVAEIATTLSPRELLAAIQQVEEQGGRIRTERWGPRTIDIDILVYDSIEVNTGELIIPHPRIDERAFVLFPLRDLNAGLVLPDGRRVSDLAHALKLQAQDIRQVADHAIFL